MRVVEGSRGGIGIRNVHRVDLTTQKNDAKEHLRLQCGCGTFQLLRPFSLLDIPFMHPVPHLLTPGSSPEWFKIYESFRGIHAVSFSPRYDRLS
jgi:hypothetical protein